MKGTSELIFGIKSGYAYFYIETQEPNKTVQDVKDSLEEYFKANTNGTKYRVAVWDYESTGDNGQSKYNNPKEMINLLENIREERDQIEAGQIVIAKNYNWFVVDQYGKSNKETVAWLLNRSTKFSSPEYRKILIIVGEESFDKAIPSILKREFAKVSYDLPDEKEIETLYQFIVYSAKGNPQFKEPDTKDKQRIIAGAKGLSSAEIIKVFSYSLVKNAGYFDPKTVEELRAEEINSTPGLKIGKYTGKLTDLIGFEIAKELADEWRDDPNAKGMIFVGPPGTGKSRFVQLLAAHYDTMCIEWELAQMQGEGLVGQKENAYAKSIAVITANANPLNPIYVFIDELEKGLAGTSKMGRQGGGDSGSTDRSNSLLLKFLSNRIPGIIVFATCNDISSLPAEYLRAGRWDTAPIFVNLPNIAEREAILNHHKKVYGLPAKACPKVDTEGWSGAELETWCKLAAKKISKGKDANDADQLILPISKTMKEDIDWLLQWKEGRTVPASKAMVVAEKKSSGRKLDM
jgi:hypothetical protein